MKNILKGLILIAVYFAVVNSQTVNAQEILEAKLEFKKDANFQFTDEWQYLSTDVYLFNGSKFEDVLNGLGRRRRGEEIQSLFCTIKIKDVKLFDNKDVIYPLYNFHVESDRKGYTSRIGDNIEVIRVIDKLPLTSDDNTLDAEISLKAITNNKSTEIIQIVANQLVNVSKITNPTQAVLSLVGEYGNLIETSNAKKEFRFSSTIRLYEEQNFDMKFHSLRLYILASNDANAQRLRTVSLERYIDENEHPDFDRKKIGKLINYDNYPYIVVINYKSLYKMETPTGDEVTKETIERRKQKVQKDYDLGLINNETKKHEDLYSGFLSLFSDLKKSLNLYKLNYEIRNTEAISKNLFSIVQNFSALKEMYNSRLREYKHNNTFNTLFKSEYNAIYNNAELYLEKDPNLRNAKLLVNTLYELNRTSIRALNSKQREDYLHKLHALDLPDIEFIRNYAEGEMIIKHIDNLERTHFNIEFAGKIKNLRNTPAVPNNRNVRNQLLELAKTTNCRMCRNKSIEAISDFNDRYELYRIKMLEHVRDSINDIANGKIIDYLLKKDCIKENLDNEQISEKLGSTKPFLTKRYNNAVLSINKLQKKITEPVKFQKVDDIFNYVYSIDKLMEDIEGEYKNICRIEELCDCSKETAEPENESPPEDER